MAQKAAPQPPAARQYNVRSVELRGENQETLEVCIGEDGGGDDDPPADDDIALAHHHEAATAGDYHACYRRPPPPTHCVNCPPPCSDPNCVACAQQCPHYPPAEYKRHEGPPRGAPRPGARAGGSKQRGDNLPDPAFPLHVFVLEAVWPL